MAILIPNMEMPETCSDCPLEYDSFVCRLTDTNFYDNEYEEDWCETRMPDCPLKEIPDVVYALGADLGKELIVPMRYSVVNKGEE